MLFNSLDFIVFFVSVVVLYFLLPYKARTFLLLLASCFFYMFFKPEYILILGFTIVLDFFLGIAIEKAASKSKKRRLLTISLISNVLVLAIFKYFNFINENISTILETAGIGNPIPYLKIILPIGLSFHTFQAMSYIIEVYRSNQKAEKNFLIYALYVMFFPQLVAGPIERPQNILYQFYEKHKPDPHMIKRGLQLILWGLFKKIVIADRLAHFVDIVYNDPYNFHGPLLILATIFFAFQIYCDFSGYSDMAIGTASILGFRLMRNFDKPYISTSLAEFWRRWHISLSTWFRDYVYIPLGGNRRSATRNTINSLAVFTLSGIWHGASWNFIIWGTLHGLLVGLNHLFSKYVKLKQTLLTTALGWLITFSLTSFCWIFFRAHSLNDAKHIVFNLFSQLNLSSLKFEYSEHFIGMNKNLALALLSILFLLSFEFNQAVILKTYRNLPAPSKAICCYILLMAIVLFGFYRSNTQFIYFQF